MTGPSSRRPKARWLAAPALAAVVALAAACTKSESSGSDTPAPTASTVTTATAPVASTTAPAESASAAPAETGATAAKDAADAGRAAAEPKSADAGHAPAAAPSGSGAAECGTKPLPDCPLQAWMKTNANPPVMKNDLPALATALDEIVRFAPPGYTNWASIAKDGAAAARSGDLAAAKASCRTCHDQYKQKYKTEIRARKI